MNLEHSMWDVINQLGPVVWYIKGIFALVCLSFTLFLPRPGFKVIALARLVAMAGMLCIGLAMVFNTALGPLGDFLFWPAYTVWLGAIVADRWPQIRAAAKQNDPSPERILLVWLTSIFSGARPVIHKRSSNDGT